jgi:hypothetical protein
MGIEVGPQCKVEQYKCDSEVKVTAPLSSAAGTAYLDAYSVRHAVETGRGGDMCLLRRCEASNSSKLPLILGSNNMETGSGQLVIWEVDD